MTPHRAGRWVAAIIGAIVVAGCPAGHWLVLERAVRDPDAVLALASHENERLPAAWQLAVDHPEAIVVLSQPAQPTPWNCQDCSRRVERLVEWGLSPARVHLMDTPVRNSRDELAAAYSLAAQRGWTSILVVTSPYHARRVAGLIRALEAGDSRTDNVFRWGVSTAAAEPISPWLWWSRRYDRRYVMYEVGAMAVNSWRYGIWPWVWWSVE